MKRSTRIALLAILAVLPSCQPRAGAALAPTAVEAEIRARSHALVAAEQRQDLDAIMPFFAQDAVFHVEAVPPVQGHAGIRQMYEEFFRMPLVSFGSSITAVEVARSGELAYETGVNELVFEREGQRITSRGKYLGIWRRSEEGQWLIAAVSITNDQPQ